MGTGSHHPRVPTLYENPQPRATGNEGHSFGLRLPADGAWGHLGADRHRKRGQSGRCRRRCKEPHTTGILLLVGMLSDKPPSSSTSPVAARGEKKKKSMLDSTNWSRLPPGARPWACQPGAAWPTSIPRQTQPDLRWRAALNTPRHSSYQSQASRHHPLSSA